MKKAASLMRLIPREILEEILSRLCSEDVFKCKTVCKTWLETISSLKFAVLHLKNSNPIPFRHVSILFFVRSFPNLESEPTWLPCQAPPPTTVLRGGSLLIDEKTGESEFRNGFNPVSWPSTHVIGICDGLICLFNDKTHLLTIWNPAVANSYQTIPTSGLDTYGIFCHGFGRKERDANIIGEDYKIVIGTLVWPSSYLKMNVIRPFTRHTWTTQPLSSSHIIPFPNRVLKSPLLKYTTKDKNDRYLDFLDKIGTIFRGILHWPACNRDQDNGDHWVSIVFTYDLEKDRMGKVSVPPLFMNLEQDHRFTLSVWNGCLSSLHVRSSGLCELWVMKEYGLTESWTKLMNFPDSFALCFGSGGFHLVGVGGGGGGDYVIGSHHPFQFLRLGKNEEKIIDCSIREVSSDSNFLSYRMSLVSPKQLYGCSVTGKYFPRPW